MGRRRSIEHDTTIGAAAVQPAGQFDGFAPLDARSFTASMGAEACHRIVFSGKGQH